MEYLFTWPCEMKAGKRRLLDAIDRLEIRHRLLSVGRVPLTVDRRFCFACLLSRTKAELLALADGA